MATVVRQKRKIDAVALQKTIDARIKSSAKLDEPAWKELTDQPRLYIWRIENFKPVPVDKAQYGQFFDGDSYVVLNAYMNSHNKLCYDVYIWIGKFSTADEYGTAAYKMAELDVKVLQDAAVQHREVQGHESNKFMDCMKKITIKKGGMSTGFKPGKQEKPEPKLLHISGVKQNVRVKEVDYCKENLTEDDVFVIDLGDTCYLINGRSCSKEEKFRGATVVNELKSDRGKLTSEIIGTIVFISDDYHSGTSHQVIDSMPHKDKKTADKKKKEERPVSLWKVSDFSGKMTMSKVSSGKCQKSSLDSNDVFILDVGQKLYVWVGNKTSKDERLQAMAYAQKYAESIDEPKLPFVRVSEGHETEEMLACLS
ncbi:Gelsolin-like protein 2 [Thelohanellus kitauei]|uniref:Gelsolin-like protein 2 n=1 Tax=Thelohanellus kitauei TaxID=669202 RepID=A0A0C2JJQ7_THEKT|nr:Gelsolin-like protein 2 [Thelohanellus kitauei]